MHIGVVIPACIFLLKIRIDKYIFASSQTRTKDYISSSISIQPMFKPMALGS